MPITAKVIPTIQAGFTNSTSNISIDDDTVADIEFMYTFSQGFNISGTIGARNMWVVQPQPWPPLAYPKIEPIERCRTQVYKHFTSMGFGAGDVIVT
jgi:hypothetical protein